MSAQSATAVLAGGSPLRRREFRLYFAGNLTSNIGNWLNNVAIGVYMHTLTHSSFWVGVAGAALFLPVIVFAMPVGVLADRTDRIVLLRRAQVFSAVLALVLTALAATGSANRYTVALISFGLGIGIAVAIPTMQSLIPSMVPPGELQDAIRYNALTFNIARVLGPTLGVAILVTLGPAWAFGFNALSFFALVVALSLIRRPPYPRTREAAAGTVREAAAYAWRHIRTRVMLLGIVAIGITLDPITTLSPALVKEYGLRTGEAGWIVAAWGGGAVAMIVLGGSVIRVATQRGLGWVGLVVLFAGIAGLGAAPAFAPALAACVVAGAGYITATMAFTTSIQRDVPESLRGRVSAMWTLAFLGPRAFASVIDGALADAVGSRPATAIFAVAALLGALLLRRVETAFGEPVPPPV